MKSHKELTNIEIAELLRDVAASLQLKNEKANKFRIVAYQRAADAVEHESSELKDLWDEGKLDAVPGVGKSIALHLDEIFKTGTSKHFQEVMKDLPPAMFELMKVPGIGPKTAYRLAHELGIRSIKDLEKSAKKGHISKLEGFGTQSEKDILKSIEEIKGRGDKRQLLPHALVIAENVITWLKEDKRVIRADPLGSMRRRAATIGDIDIAVSTNDPVEILDRFINYPNTQRVLEKGPRTSSIIVPGNIQVDLMVETPDAYGALLQHFTGSKHHNIALREYALKKKLSLSDYGIYVLNNKGVEQGALKSEGTNRPMKRDKSQYKELKKMETEEQFYNFLGMDYIQPELREDMGEIKAALEHRLPKLIELKDINSDLHIHSNFDIETSHDLGESTMEELVEKANSLNYEYVSFSEHNPSQSRHNGNQIVEILKRKREKVDNLNYIISKNKTGSVQKVFNSLEIDIKTEGGLPVPDNGMDTLDFALVSIHSSFKQDKEIMTKRIISALSHPKARIFAHPTARKINEREGVEIDWTEIFNFCLANKKWIEINSDPMRLDLPDNLVREAVKFGVKMTIDTDAHHRDGMEAMIWGASVARRGWAEKKDIINCLTLKEFEKVLQS